MPDHGGAARAEAVRDHRRRDRHDDDEGRLRHGEADGVEEPDQADRPACRGPTTMNAPNPAMRAPVNPIAAGGLRRNRRSARGAAMARAAMPGITTSDPNTPRSHADMPELVLEVEVHEERDAEEGEAERRHAGQEEVEGADLAEALEGDAERDGELARVLGQLLPEHRLHLVAAAAGLLDARQADGDRDAAVKRQREEHPPPALRPGDEARDAAGEDRSDDPAGELEACRRRRTPATAPGSG